MTTIKFAVRSAVGKVRTNNEDNFYCNGIFMTEQERERPFFLSGITGTPCIFAVFDGMGGEQCGELASLTAAKCLQENAPEILSNPAEAGWGAVSYVHKANSQLLDIMRAQKVRMGTTMVMAIAGESSFTVCNLGDSQGFKFSGGRLLRVTDDHTVAAEKVRMGIMTPAQAAKSHENHILLRWLGDYDEINTVPDVTEAFMFDDAPGGLLCSDGLTDMLAFKEISAIMQTHNNPADAVNALVYAALERGGVDNVTCLVFMREEEQTA